MCIWLNQLLNGEKSVTKEYLTPAFFILQVFLQLKTNVKQYYWGKQMGLCKRVVG